MSITRNPQESTPANIIWARILMVLALVCLLASFALGTYLTLGPNTPTPNQSSTPHTHNIPVTADQHQAEVAAVVQQYMNAFLGQHYDTMWAMLHPEIQTTWNDQATFIQFWKTHFQDYTLQNFTTGQAHDLPIWTNPETMIQYTNVTEIPVSLQIEIKKMPSQQLAPLAPQFLHPSMIFRDLPFILQRTTPAQGNTGASSQWRILVGGPADLEAPILPPFTQVSKKIRVPILMYHHISDVKAKNILDLSLTITPTMFNKQLNYLKHQGYHSITFNQLFEALYYNGPLPTKPIILTFDDGYDDAYKFAYPSLKTHGYSGMFYIITGKVGWQGQATWDQMHDMLTNGMQFGSHTIHHINIGQVLLNSRIQAQQEVQISQTDLQKHLGIVVQQFCYPSGEPFRHGSLAVRQQVMALLAANGYVGATTDPGLTGLVQDSQTPLALLRVRVDGRESLLGFMLSVP